MESENLATEIVNRDKSLLLWIHVCLHGTNITFRITKHLQLYVHLLKLVDEVAHDFVGLLHGVRLERGGGHVDEGWLLIRSQKLRLMLDLLLFRRLYRVNLMR